MAKELKNLLVNYIFEKELLIISNKYLHGRLIDIGCGAKPYKVMLDKIVSEHIGIDRQGTLHAKHHIDIYATAYNIPVIDCSFDSVLSTAVLEHLENPEKALQECYRILKNGGIAVYSVPFIWHLHEEPRDFYRFSKYGLMYLFNKVGFEIVELKALSGFWVTFGQLLVYNLYRLKQGILKWFFIIDLFGLFIQLLAYLLDKIDKTEQWTWMYIVVAKK